MLFPRKLRAPMATRDTRRDVLEYSALIIDSPSATTVPGRPSRGRDWSGLTSSPKLDPVCLHSAEVISKTTQIVDDERAVPEYLREEFDIGQTGDRVGDPVMQAVQGIPCPA